MYLHKILKIVKINLFIGEQDTSTLIEFESRDVAFLENDFPQQGEIGYVTLVPNL